MEEEEEEGTFGLVESGSRPNRWDVSTHFKSNRSTLIERERVLVGISDLRYGQTVGL